LERTTTNSHVSILADSVQVDARGTGLGGVRFGSVGRLLASDVGKRPTGSGSADATQTGAFVLPLLPGGASLDPEGASLGGGSPSLVSSTPNAHNVVQLLPCGGWLREVCHHGNVRWIPLRCHKWPCEVCGPGKHMEFLERLCGAMTLSREKGWTLKFVTLTWAANVDKKRVRLDLAHFVQGVRRRYGFCEYAKVPELTKVGRIHLHLAMVMPYIPQRVLSSMWRSYAKAPVVDIRAVTDVNRLKGELAKYLTKVPAGKVTYSRQFPAAERLRVETGPCDACGGQEHRFEYCPEWWAVQEYPLEEHGRWLAGEPVYQVMCRCWPVPT